MRELTQSESRPAGVERVHDAGPLRITTVMTGDPWRENCYVVMDRASRSAVIVDPGAAEGVILATVEAQGARVSKVLLTHGHHDHVGAVAPVCRSLNVPCAVHPADMRLVRQAPLWAFRFAGKRIETPSPMVELTDDVVRIGGASLNVIRVPGHTPGGIAFASNGFCMTGDTLLLEHIGRTDLPGGHAPTLQQSVDALLSVLSADTILLAGHGREWTAGEALGWWSRVRAAPPVLDEHQTAS